MTAGRGYFDIHLHGISDTDTASESSESILRIARYQKSQGTDRIVLSVYPDEIGKMRKDMEVIGASGEKIREKNLNDCAQIAGLHLEGPFLNPKFCGALKKQSFLEPSVHLLKTLIDGYEGLIKMITIAPELSGAEHVIRACRDEGIAVSMGHSDATYSEAEAGKNAGATGITHLFNAMRPFHHREPGISGLGLSDDDMYVEIIADGVHLDLRTLRLVFRMKPENRIILVSDAVKGRRAGNSGVYTENGILAGSGVALKDEVAYLLKNGIDPDRVRRAASENPERFLNS
jgi:N-acetylglucosamine-6-phosphate deacetylase